MQSKAIMVLFALLLVGGAVRQSAQTCFNLARFNKPYQIAQDTAGNLYVTDSGHCRIRMIGTDRVITTIAGSGQCVSYSNPITAFVDGDGHVATFSQYTWGITVGSDGNIYVTDNYYCNVRQLKKTGSAWKVSLYAGIYPDSQGNHECVVVNGTGSNANFNVPNGITADQNGYLYVAESLGNIRMIDTTSDGTQIPPRVPQVVTTYMGLTINQNNWCTDSGDDTSATCIRDPMGIAFNPANNSFLVAEYQGNRIRRVDSSSSVPTVYYTPTQVETLAAYDVKINSNGTFFSAPNHTINKIVSQTSRAVVAGVLNQACAPGTDATCGDGSSSAKFSSPEGLLTDSAGNIFVADTDDHTIRMLNSTYAVSTIGGRAGDPNGAGNGNIDGIPGPLTASKNSSSITLNWFQVNDTAGANFTVKYCAMTTAGCSPTTALSGATNITSLTTTDTLDTTAGTGHLYSVTAQNSCSTSAPSNVAVQYVKPLLISAFGNLGVNWVSLPYFNNFSVAHDICLNIGTNATSVAKYNIATDTFTTHNCALSGVNNFSITAGEAYLIKIKTADTNWTIVGSHDNSLAIKLKHASGNLGVNWISFPFNTTATVAHDICNDIGSEASSVAKYNVGSDTFTTHNCAISGVNNFSVTPGEAYLIKVKTIDVTWVPSHF